MKLIGSKIEDEHRSSLIESNQSLFNSENRLIEKLRAVYPEMVTAYVLDWIPEQEEEIYKILINDSIIVQIEVNRYNNGCIVTDTISISEYFKIATRTNKIRLTVALDLVMKDMKKNAGK